MIGTMPLHVRWAFALGLMLVSPSVASAQMAPPVQIPAAPFGLFWSDVPTGAETTCPTSMSQLISPPGQTTALSLTGVTMAPCNSGTINIGPIRPPGSAIPS